MDRYKLVKIEHFRCDEYDCTSYALAPSEWSEHKIADEISQVRRETIEDAKKIKESPLKPPYQPPYTAHPDKTVAEVQALHAEQKAAYKEWLEKNHSLSRSFMTRLSEHGFVRFGDDNDNAQTISVHWGHSHGLSLNYDQEDW